MLQGVITALVTPMYDNGEIDYISLANLIEFQIDAKVAALVVAGTTAEAAMLDGREKLAVIEYVIKQVKGRVSIIVGVNDIGTQIALQTVRQLNQIVGIDYLLVTVPMYIKPTQNGMYQHFYQIANLSTVPILLYNVPGRTASTICYDTVLELAKACDNIVGIKDASGDLTIFNNLDMSQEIFKHFGLYSGDDISAVEFILSGGRGVISVISNLLPTDFGLIINYALNGTNDVVKSSRIREMLRVIFIESNPIPIKWLLAKQGLISSPQVRLPLTVLSPKFRVQIEQVFDEFKKI